MKKFILPILLAFVSLLVLVDQVTAQTLHPPDAQTKKIATCEEWKDIYGTEECPNAARKGGNNKEIWCYDPKVAESYAGGFGEYVGNKVYETSPTYTVDFDYNACLESWVKEKGITPPVSDSAETQPPETPRQARQPSGSAGPGLIEFFGINPYQTWLRVKEMMEVTEFIGTGGLETATEKFFSQIGGKKTIAEREVEQIKAREDSYKRAFGENWQEAIYRQPALTPKVEQKAWETKAPAGENVTDVSGVSNTKRYSWDTDSGAVINTSSWKNIEFKEPVVDDQEITRTVKFKGSGEVEIKVKNIDPEQNKIRVETDFFDLFVIQTHFWINQDTDKKVAVVGVYEGEVEIRSKDGKTIRIKPEGDKPGTLVISKKFSIAKLAIVSVIAVASIGGLVWFIKKKIAKQGRRRP